MKWPIISRIQMYYIHANEYSRLNEIRIQRNKSIWFSLYAYMRAYVKKNQQYFEFDCTHTLYYHYTVLTTVEIIHNVTAYIKDSLRHVCLVYWTIHFFLK